MDHKILFVDLDATLLCDDKSVSEGNRRAIHKMLEAGHYIAFATGRSVESGRQKARELGLTVPGCYMLAYNGALLYDCSTDRVLLKYSLPFDVVQELFLRAKKAGIYVQTYYNENIITTEHTRELDFYQKKTGLSYQLSPNIMEILGEEPQKVLLIDLEDKERLISFQKENLVWEKEKCNSFFSCDEYLEYCPLGVDKGAGVKALTEILGIPLENTVAVGDEENDISMIKKAHVGVAMQNGISELKNLADYVTEHDNNHDAIAEVIEKFIL